MKTKEKISEYKTKSQINNHTKKRAGLDLRKPKKNLWIKPVKTKQIIKSRKEAQRKIKRRISQESSSKIKKKVNSWVAQDKLKQVLFWRRKTYKKDYIHKNQGKNQKWWPIEQNAQPLKIKTQRRIKNPKQKKELEENSKDTRWEAATRERSI